MQFRNTITSVILKESACIDISEVYFLPHIKKKYFVSEKLNPLP
jgi:hypothetical protein